ncbi:hypothetical protein RJT34_11079 [Clitoria ternatea]|uniref:Uncharacterized protein n=1 Tax=Clitoria ternatea TaxID=43366 RepID=A0AAN9JL97_CLITE
MKMVASGSSNSISVSGASYALENGSCIVKQSKSFPSPTQQHQKEKCHPNKHVHHTLLCSFSCFILHFSPTTTTSSISLNQSLSSCFYLNSWIDLTNIFNYKIQDTLLHTYIHT